MPEEKAGEDVAPAVFVTEPLQYTDALPQPRDVQAGPFVGSGPLNAGTDTARSSSDLMTGVVVTQPMNVQAGPFVGSGPLNAGTDTARTSSDLMTGGTITQPKDVLSGTIEGLKGPLNTRFDTGHGKRSR